MRRLLPGLSILIAAFFAFGTVLTKEITERTMVGVKESRLDEIFALLGAFVVVSLVAAALVATSTFRIVFAQRMKQLALLRAIGASRGRLVRMLVAEGAATGLVSAVGGVGLAYVVSLAVPLAGLVAPGFPVATAIGVVAGLGVLTTLAVLAPALSVSRVSPLEALRTSATQDSRARLGLARWTLGLLLAAGAAAVLFRVASVGLKSSLRPGGLTEELLLLTVLSATLAFGALSALGPALMAPLLRIVGTPLRRMGPVGQLAVGGVGGAPRRAAAITAVVALGVSLVIGVLVGAETLRSLGKAELAGAYPADLEFTGTLPDIDQLRANDKLSNVLPYRRFELEVTSPARPLGVAANDLDMRSVSNIGDFRFESGSPAALGPGRVVLTSKAAGLLDVTAGDSVRLSFEGKETTTTVAATVFGSIPLHGSVVLDPSDANSLGVGPALTGVIANGPSDAVPGFEVESLADRRAAKESWFFSLVAVAIGLLTLTMIIAVVGVGSTTALSVLERTRESGLLRAVGLSRAGLRAVITTESALYGVIGSLIGLALGLPYAWLGVVSLGLDWPLKIPVGQVVLVVAVLAVLTAIAGLLPARRAAQVSPVAALNTA